MTSIEELDLLLKLIRKYDLPLSPILEYAVNEKKEQFQGQNNEGSVKQSDFIVEKTNIVEVKSVSKTLKPKKRDKIQRPQILKRSFIPNPDEKKDIKLTREMIEAARTPNGGFTKSQLAAIGIGWPPPNNWISEKEGEMISKSQYDVFNHIQYAKPSKLLFSKKDTTSYIDVASDEEEKQRMEAVLSALSNFDLPATPRDVVRSIDTSIWKGDVREDTVDSILKKLPEVKYIKWGKYILKSKIYDKD